MNFIFIQILGDLEQVYYIEKFPKNILIIGVYTVLSDPEKKTNVNNLKQSCAWQMQILLKQGLLVMPFTIH